MKLLELKEIIKQDKQQTLLKNINFTVSTGQAVGIKMASSESHMLFDLILKKSAPSSGQIVYEDSSILLLKKDDQCYEWQTVGQYLSLFKKISGANDDLFELAPIFSLQDIWKCKIKQLSEEQKKRVVLCRAFLTDANLLIIENPTLNITTEGIDLYLASIRFLLDHGRSILFTSYYTEELALLCDEVYIYHSGNGLEKTDLIIQEDSEHSEEPITPPMQPVFKIASKIADKTIFFSPEEIDFIESINGISNLRVGEESFPTTFTLNELEHKLSLFGFFRCHRSYLVNLQRITELVSYSRNSYTLVLKGQQQTIIPLSRSRLEQMKELLEF